MKNLRLILDTLKARQKEYKGLEYNVPKLWLVNEALNTNDFFEYHISKIESILNKSKVKMDKYSHKDTICYNLFPRLATAYNHSNIDNPPFRMDGSLLKCISILDYIASLGTNTIQMLPLTCIGKHNKKGNLGSPYCIADHYKIDENLSELILGLGSEVELKAFVEAAHHFGIRVLFEFVFRTSSLDNQLALSKPNFYYWIKSKRAEEFSSPTFETEDVLLAKSKIIKKDYKQLPEPNSSYKEIFSNVPLKVEWINDKIVGLTEEEIVEIPGGFADWPPDDPQPAWTDVTYFKMYDYFSYNYMAYNTLRMYDEELALTKHENTELWDYLANILPYYIENYKIDGAMIDMGHAMPTKLMKRIVDSAREMDKDFIFWEENFIPDEHSIEQGYDASLGYLFFDVANVGKIKEFIGKIENNQLLPVFLAPETHNTKRLLRLGDNSFKCVLFTITFLPEMLYIHNGIEIGEIKPVNTGLGFTIEELKQYSYNDLALFSSQTMNWDSGYVYYDFLKDIIDIRKNIIGKIERIEQILYSPCTIIYNVFTAQKAYNVVCNYSDAVIIYNSPYKIINNMFSHNCNGNLLHPWALRLDEIDRNI